MSEPEVTQPNFDAAPAPKTRKGQWQRPPGQKTKLSWKKEQALVEVIERKRISDRVDYKAIAQRHGCRTDYLRRIYQWWTEGHIELSAPQTEEETKVDAEMQNGKRLQLLRRYEGLVLASFEALIFEAEDEQTKGKPIAWKELGLPAVVTELKNIGMLRLATEKDHGRAMADMMAARDRLESVMPGKEAKLNLKMISADEHKRAMDALDAELAKTKENGQHGIPATTPEDVPQEV